jgi:acetyl-CoA carboxylase alpha subunit
MTRDTASPRKTQAIAAIGDAIEQALEPLLVLSGAELRHRRRQKFLGMGNGAARTSA